MKIILDTEKLCVIPALNTSSEEEPDEFIHPGAWIAQESLNFLWYINKIQSKLNGGIKNVSNEGKQRPQGNAFIYSENCLELAPHWAGESSSVQGWWNGTLVTQARKFTSNQNKISVTLQSTNSGEPPLFTTHLLTKDMGANLLVEEQKFIDPFFHVFNVTFSVLPGTRHCCRSSG